MLQKVMIKLKKKKSIDTESIEQEHLVSSYLIDPIECPLVLESDLDEFIGFVDKLCFDLRLFYKEISVSSRLSPDSIGKYIYIAESFRYTLHQIIVCLEMKSKKKYESLHATRDRMEIERVFKVLQSLEDKINSQPKFIEYGFELMSTHNESKIPINVLVSNPILTLFANRFINEILLVVVVLKGSIEIISDLITCNEGFKKIIFHQQCRPLDDHMYI